MKLLAIDCSTPHLSIALLQNNCITHQHQVEHHPPEPNPVLPLIDQTLAVSGCSLENLDGFALTLGPGSFTGLRVGLSLIKGFVLALEKPVVGIGSLEAWAYCANTGEYPVCSVLDARKGEVYYARFRGGPDRWETLEEPRVAPPEEITQTTTEKTVFIGTGLDRYGPQWEKALGERFIKGGTLSGLSPAGAVALLAARRFDTEKCFDLNQLSLRYVRRPEAEVHLNKR